MAGKDTQLPIAVLHATFSAKNNKRKIQQKTFIAGAALSRHFFFGKPALMNSGSYGFVN
jgi:hypothetical protein